MNEAAIYGVLTELFHDVFADDSIVLRPETSAPDVEGWDSFTNLNLIVAVEGRFGIRMQTTEIEQLQNVGDLVATIARKLRA
jgi:acyl carrier protein